MQQFLASLHNPILFQFLGMCGVLSASLGSLIAAIPYRGKAAERYSPLNHFISELGEIGVSQLAWVFNLGLVVCGLFLLPACLILGYLLQGVLAKLGMLAGILTAIGISAVGIYPMNNLTPHTRAAFIFFRGGLAMILLFSLAIAFQPPSSLILPRLYALAGLPAVLAFSFFLVYSRGIHDTPQDPLAPLQGPRPRIGGMAMAEWSIFLPTVFWFLLIALGL